MSKNISLSVFVVLLAVVVLAGVAGYFLLPDVLCIQITASGASGTTVPKLVGLLLPVALSALGLIMKKSGENTKALAVSLIALLVMGFTFVVNML